MEKSTIERVKTKLKQNYPGVYALKIVQTLRRRKVSVTRQQVYNFFNHIPVTHRVEIYNTALNILFEDRIQHQEAYDMAEMSL